jgi:radical SAM family uncharacterized protein
MSEVRGALALEKLLRSVQKPGRYTGGEWNALCKDPAKVRLKVALAFPDVYEIGMSYLGQKILYDLLNRRPDFLAERVFAPWPDFERALRAGRVPLPSVETKTPLGDFDVIGFSLLYELNYSNILTMLDLAGLALRSKERPNPRPLVMAGGPAAFNPEPVAEIFDLFVIGDGEEAFLEVLARYAEARSICSSKDEILRDLAGMAGIYVPSLYESFRPPGSPLLAVRPKDTAPPVVDKRVFLAFDRAPFPTAVVVPNVETVFDRVAVEVARGCPQKCRFCQATSLYAPYRVKDPDSVVASVFASLAATGYEDASLFSLSVGDYPYLEPVVSALMDGLEKDRVALSLSSLRPGSLSAGVARAITRVRKTGFTLVPEAGSDRLRRVINKGLTEEEILEAAAKAFEEGWRLLKLYVMIGLPTETAGDVGAIVELGEKITALGRRLLGGAPRINLSVSSFIPKPHTPFQWAAMEAEADLRAKQVAIKCGLRRHRSVKVKAHSVDSSVLEAIFSRGDRRLSEVLVRAWRKGARFDSWTETFRPDLWAEAMAEEGLDPQTYLGPLDPSAPLPWDHVRTGISASFLRREFSRAQRSEPTPSCLEAQCGECRGCDFWPQAEKTFRRWVVERPFARPEVGIPSRDILRYRVFFAKTGPARWIGHHDLVNTIERSLRRAGFRPAYSEGFHPKMRLVFAPPLPLGMEGREEVFEFRAGLVLEVSSFLAALNRHAPLGLRFERLARLSDGEPPLHQRIVAVDYGLKRDGVEVPQALARIREGRSWLDLHDAAILERLAREAVRSGLAAPAEVSEAPAPEPLGLRFPFNPARPPRPQDFVARILGLSHPSHFLIRRRFVFADEKCGDTSLNPQN